MENVAQGQFSCASCGRTYRWKPELAGRRVRCKCGTVMTAPAKLPVPDDQLEQDLYAMAEEPATLTRPQPSSGGMRCPGCQAPMTPGAVLCTSCGFDLRTGTRVKAATPLASPAIPLQYRSPVNRTGSRYVEYAGFWMRFVAAFIDGLVLFVPGFLVAVVEEVLIASASDLTFVALVGAISWVVTIAMAWLYSALLESSRHQATLGKMAMGIIVTDQFGERISFGRATGRHFGKFLSQLILFIGYLMAAFTEKKQALHDMMAKTFVVRR